MADVEITVKNNGPLRVSGKDIVIVDQDGNRFDLAGREVIALCRCGQSQDKPFCDGSHKKCEFQSVTVARTLAPPG